MTKIKDYIQLHLNILLFSLTSVFSKLASVYYNNFLFFDIHRQPPIQIHMKKRISRQSTV